MIAILRKEFSSFLNSLVAYIVIGIFLIAMGLLVWVFPETSVLDYGYADLDVFFSLCPYVFIFLIPAITMRSFAEERRGGTMELLLTKPLTDWDLVLGKFLASFLLVLVALIPTVVYYYLLYRLGSPVGNIDSAAVVGSYIGLGLLSGSFCAVGIFASSITPNQIVSFMVSAFLCFILFEGFNSVSEINTWSTLSLVIKKAGILYHYEALGKGLIDSRDVVYFFCLTALTLLSTKTILGSRTW